MSAVSSLIPDSNRWHYNGGRRGMRSALDYGEVITESVEQLQEMLKKVHEPLIRRRLRFLLLLKQNKGMSRAAAGKKLGLLPTGAEKMWKLYHTAGIDSFVDYPFKGRKSYLNQQQKSWLQEEL